MKYSKCLLLISLGFFFYHSANASRSLHSDFELRVEGAQINSMLERMLSADEQSLDIPMEDRTVATPVAPIQIRGLGVHLNFHIPKPQSSHEPREWAFDTRDISAQIRVGEISASKEIIKVINGIRIRIKIEARCTNGLLSLPSGAAHVAGKIRAEMNQGQIQFLLKDFQAEWEPGSWQVDSLDCNGPEGFGELIGEAAKYELRSISPFLDTIRESIANELNRIGQDAVAKLFEKATLSNPNYHIAIQPLNLRDGADQSVIVNGLLKIKFLKLNPGQEIVQEIHFDETDSDSSVTVPGASGSLLIPFETLQASIKDLYQNGWLKTSWMSSEIDGFKKFMKNRLLQLFLWTDLWHFKSDTNFKIDLQAASEPEMDLPESWALGTLQTETQVPLLLEIFAPKNNDFDHYVDFETQIGGVTHFVQEGREILIQFNQKKLVIKKHWNDEWLKKHSTYKHIATKFVSKALNKAITGKGFRFSIPSFQFTDGTELTPLTWNMEGKNLRVYLSL